MKKISFLWLSPTLTAIGKKFGIDAHYFAKNSSLVVVGHGISILKGIITGFFVARFFEQEVYGTYQFILSILGMLSLFGLPGFSHSVARAWVRKESFSLKLITIEQLKMCLVASALLLGSIPFLGHYGRGELWPLFAVAAVLFPLAPIAMVHFGASTVARAKFDVILKVNIISSILVTLATLLVIFLHQSALLMLIISMLIVAVVNLLFVHVFNHDLLPKEGEVGGKENTKAIIRYGWQLTFSTLPINLVWYVDKLMISQMFGLNQLALFAVALLIPEQAKLFVKQLLPITFSKQAAGIDGLARRRKLLKAVLVGMVIFAIGISLYIAICPWLMPLLFPNYDSEQLVLLTSVAAATLIVMPSSLFVQYLEARGMIREIQISNVVASVLFGISISILIPLYGLLGAMLARGVFRISYMSLSWWFVMTTPIENSNQSTA